MAHGVRTYLKPSAVDLKPTYPKTMSRCKEIRHVVYFGGKNGELKIVLYPETSLKYRNQQSVIPTLTGVLYWLGKTYLHAIDAPMKLVATPESIRASDLLWNYFENDR